jgi:hypothetical protein
MLLFQFNLNLNLNYDKQYFSASRKYSWKIINMCTMFAFFFYVASFYFIFYFYSKRKKINLKNNSKINYHIDNSTFYICRRTGARSLMIPSDLLCCDNKGTRELETTSSWMVTRGTGRLFTGVAFSF